MRPDFKKKEAARAGRLDYQPRAKTSFSDRPVEEEIILVSIPAFLSATAIS